MRRLPGGRDGGGGGCGGGSGALGSPPPPRSRWKIEPRMTLRRPRRGGLSLGAYRAAAGGDGATDLRDRPKMLRRILRTVAEFGVSNLHLINSARVDKSYWQSPLLSRAKLKEALIVGMERSQDTIAPLVHCHQRFRPFLEDQLPQLCNGRPCWITDKGAPMALSQTPAVPALVMIGPEGGFVPFEIELATSLVAHRVHLGERILSVDTALPAVLAQGLML